MKRLNVFGLLESQGSSLFFLLGFYLLEYLLRRYIILWKQHLSGSTLLGRAAELARLLAGRASKTGEDDKLWVGFSCLSFL